jgi:hypothetical protein
MEIGYYAPSNSDRSYYLFPASTRTPIFEKANLPPLFEVLMPPNPAGSSVAMV